MSLSSKPQNFRDAFQKEPQYLGAIINGLQKNYPDYARKIKGNLKVAEMHLGAWYELMVYDWLCKQGKYPYPEPTILDGKPDFVFTSNDKKIYVEVGSVKESKKDKQLEEREDFVLTQTTATFAAMRERLIDKACKYESVATTGDAYVVCLGLESSLINIADVKTCFLGDDGYNLSSGSIQSTINGDVFARENDGTFLVNYKHISAILVATRNFTLNEDDNKLAFGLIQNPYAVNEIQPTEFGEILRFVVVTKKEKYFQMAWQN